MAKKKYYWKAVRIEGKRYTSRIVQGKYCLVYPVGKWVKPPAGKIFIFRTQNDALIFSGSPGTAWVKKCKAKGVTKPRGDKMDYWKPRKFRFFWRKIFKNGSLPISTQWPCGTLWADAIKIIE